MAIAFIQYAQGTSGSGVANVSTSSLTLTAGNLAVVSVLVGNGTEQHVSSVTDSLGNAYTFAGTHIFNASLFGGAALEVWYCQNCLGGTTTVTANWSSAGGFSLIELGEYSGIATSGALDVAISSEGAGTPTIGPSSSTAQAEELVIAAVSTDSTGCVAAAGYTNRSSDLSFLDMVTSVAGAQSYNPSSCTSGNYVANLLTFKAASGPVVLRNYGLTQGSGTITSMSLNPAIVDVGGLVVINGAFGTIGSPVISSVTDTLGNVWFPIPNTYFINTAQNVGAGMWGSVITVGGTTTITINWSGGSVNGPGIALIEFGNVDTIDQSAGQAINSTPVTPTITTTESVEMLFAGMFTAGANPSPSGSWSRAYQDPFNMTMYQVVSSTGSFTGTQTGAGSQQFISNIASFYKSGAPPPSTPNTVVCFIG